jgi:hypothetical protein
MEGHGKAGSKDKQLECLWWKRKCVKVIKKKKTPWLLIRARAIPTEPPPLFGEVSANFCG